MQSDETTALSPDRPDGDVFVLAVCARFGGTEVLLTPMFARELEVARQDGVLEAPGE